MVTQVFVQNSSQFTFAVNTRTRSSDPLNAPLVAGKSFDVTAKEIKPGERVSVLVIQRHKIPGQEKHEILTDLTILDAEGNPTEVTIVLKQKVHGKLLGSSLQISLSASPYELLAPEQGWAKTNKLFEGHLSLSSGIVDIVYRYIQHTSGDDVEYVIKQNPTAAPVDDLPEESCETVVSLPADVVVEEVYENQRGNGLSGPKSYSSKSLFPGTERGQWSNVHGQYRLSKDYIDLPNKSWKWLFDWKVDTSGDCDEEGWQYAFSWQSTWSKKCTARCFVRRRRWIRTRKRINEEGEKVVPRKRSLAFSEDIKTSTDLMQKLKDRHVLDFERTELLRAFFRAEHDLNAAQLQQALQTYQFDSGRVEAIRALCPTYIRPDQVASAIDTINFFSYKRQLATEFDLELTRAVVVA